MSQIVGHISQVIGPVVDVYFEGKDIDTELLLPSIHDALEINARMERLLLWKFNNTLVKTPSEPLLWIARMVCNVA